MNKYKIIRAVFIVLGTALLVMGIAEENYRDIFMKATRICYECIGIG